MPEATASASDERKRRPRDCILATENFQSMKNRQ